MRPTRPVVEQPTGEQQATPGFMTPEGLRGVLERLHRAGPRAWRHDAEAAALLRYTIDRYGALARKHHLEAADAGVAAFLAMLNESTRTAEDPWAVVTTAVRRTLIAEERAEGLLTSTDRARRPEVSVNHDAMRFSDREHDLADYHPALQVHDSEPEVDAPSVEVPVRWATDSAVRLLAVAGWPPEVARASVDYVCARLVDAGDRHTAYDGLRKDKAGRARLDLDHQHWIGLLRFLLGHPTNPSPIPRLGALARMLIGDRTDDLLADRTLIRHVTWRSRLAGDAR